MHRPSRRLLLTVATALVAGPAVAQTPPTAELRNGRWQPVATATAPPLPDPELDRIEQLLTAGHNADAQTHLVLWVKSHPGKSPQKDRALFLFAQAYYQLGNRIKAFYYCDELMDEYPESPHFYPALQKQYQIADAYLSGYKNKFLGLPLLEENDEAIEMMYRIQQRSPGSPLAEKALLRTGDYFYSNRDYDLAHDVYARYVKNYPRSPLVATVRLREAFASLAQFRGVLFDPTNILDARSQLLDMMTAYPDLAREEDLGAIVHAIDETLGAKLLATADFYRRTHAPGSAVYLYRYLILTYPAAPQIPAAREALSQMPQSALDQPMPLPGEQYVPPSGMGSPERSTPQ